MIYCYIRISTDHQDYDRQTNILKEKGYIDGENCEYIQEVGTGKRREKRFMLEELVNNKIVAGDTIVATELSRISRSVKDFNNLIDEILKKKKVNIIILKENFNLLANGQMDAMTKLILNITSCFAEFEADIISDRTKESLRAKKINGTKSGRPIGRAPSKSSSKSHFIYTLKLVLEGKNQKDACELSGMSYGAFIGKIKQIRNRTGFYELKDVFEYIENGGDY